MTGSTEVRRAEVKRETKETSVYVNLSLGPGDIKVVTPIKFLNHMVETFMFYMGSSGEVMAEDLRGGFDDHHVVEDVFITLGMALDRALGDRVGIRRFGWSMVPMDDALAATAIDLGGRVYWVFRGGSFVGERIGDLTTQMVPHIIRTLATHVRATIHAEIRWGGENDHHMAEALFKSLGLSMAQAMEYVGDKAARSLKGGTMQ